MIPPLQYRGASCIGWQGRKSLVPGIPFALTRSSCAARVSWRVLMDEKRRNVIEPFDDQDDQRNPLANDEQYTETIEVVTARLGEDVTASGSFDLRGIETTTVGKLLQALPIGTLIIDETFHISFVNRAFERICMNPSNIEGSPISILFPNPTVAQKVKSLITEVFTGRKSRGFQAMLGTRDSAIWGRLHLRPVRVATQRSVLVLVEDWTAEKRELMLIQEHEGELLRAQNELSKRVEERTAELKEANELLKREIKRRKLAQDQLQAGHDELERRVRERTAEISKKNEQLRGEIIQRNLAEEALRKSEERYRAVVQDQTELVCRYRVDGTPTFVNDAYCRFWGETAENLMKQSFLDRLPDQHREIGRTRRELASNDNIVRTYEEQVESPDGEPRWLQWTERAIPDEQGHPSEFQAVGRDITDLKLAERILLQGARSKAVADLTSVAGHNFNNLLQIVIGGTQLAMTNLELGNLDIIKETLDEIHQAALLGAETVKRLHYLAHVQADTKRSVREVLDLSRTVHMAIEISRPWWKNSPEKEGIRIDLNRHLQPNCFVRANDNELFELVIDLLENATEALVEGGRIDVRTFAHGDSVFLQFRDCGIGIPRENHERIFEPFWTTKPPPAAGMGLASALHIVKRHHGKISVESVLGQGTTFTVRLPFVRPQRETADLSDEAGLGPYVSVLVVDDREPVLMALNKGLSDAGHKVFPALSGKKALDIFQTRKIDAVICDLGMPEMNGWRTAAAIKNLCRERGVQRPPFILLTGWGGQLDAHDKMVAHGVERIVEKPVNISHLVGLIRELLKNPRIDEDVPAATTQ